MARIRLLEGRPNGDIGFRETNSGDVPAYAILSHVWLKHGEGEEVLFLDLEAGADRSKTKRKAGWRKIQFCAKQAAADGLQYFWVDTCCIDKRSSAELSAAVNSMFRWYQNAARCYVYLSDIPKPGTTAGNKQAVIEDFKASRWFKRGWTLQELIAPKEVDFFCSNGERLGNKLLLEEEVYEVTRIAKSALRGEALSTFSIKERRSWAECRHTTIEEDQAYCLIGICQVSMVVNYGEGKDKAFRRLEEEIHKSNKGFDFEQYAVELNLSSIPEPAQFVAREKELTDMHERLHGHNTRTCVVLHGLGGMGKTQLARQYIKRYKEKYTSAFWLNANDHESLRRSFRDITQQILKSHPETSLLIGIDLDDLDRVEHAVKAWFDLKENNHWLLIFDNYDNPRIAGNADRLTVDIRKHLPPYDQGSVIITTRSSRVSQGHRIKVEKLPDLAQSLEILSNTSGRASIELDSGAIALAQELDGLPLALATAGAYLEHVTTTFSDYLRLYRASWSKLQKTSPQLESYEDRSLYSTWQVTLDRIEGQNPSAARLLKLWAYLYREDVWFELLRHADSAEDERIRELVADELTFNEAVSLLCSFGLVDPHRSLQQRPGSGGYSIHSCIHSWTVSVLNDEWDDDLARLALTCVASEIPSTDREQWWLQQQGLLHHAARLAGNLYSDQGKLAEAEQMYTRALQGYEEALGPKHTSTLGTVNNLGNLYISQGKLAEAEQMCTRALRGYEEALGPKHTSTLDTVNNLGNLYKSQGKLAEAEQMYTRALRGYEEALGPQLIASFLPALNIMFAFGSLFSQIGRKDEAVDMYSRALSGYQRVQGPSSKWCRVLEARLQDLGVETLNVPLGTSRTVAQEGTLRQKFRTLGRRLKIGK